MFTKFDKALAAILVPTIALLLKHFTGFEGAPGLQETGITLLTAFFVWAVPNKTV